MGQNYFPNSQAWTYPVLAKQQLKTPGSLLLAALTVSPGRRGAAVCDAETLVSQ